ncbi:ATP-binding cassette domain-containing protein [Uliginosibacterium sp. H3]|uniref:ATP-binding cassette domain-containing protein n=1 Tax=Uliginosibacterium silvisoli TaxID=3114758 RepID=A0ABU6JZW4_9RHOO|nr:ATP-binding cassette domain-containing protein [Uliginosibacterium sp. H3]
MQINPEENSAVASSAFGIALSVRGVHKRYGEREVLKGINLDIKPGEFVAIVGRSGCGKSTLLRLIAGLESGQEGQLLYDGSATDNRDATRIMFQDSRLLPWKRVGDNVALGLPPHEYINAEYVLGQVGLRDRRNEWPARLSGGQRQRVALARALVHKPRLLLLDEPLGALDALTRIEMHTLIESLWRESGFTALLVTHDVSEAIVLADRVVLIDEGRITLDERIDLPRPRNRGSAAFAALEERVLRRVLQQAPNETNPETEQTGDVSLHRTVDQVRWAV